MTEHDKRWNMQYEKLVEFRTKNGHCMVPQSYEQDKSFGKWVSAQRTINYNNTIRLDRKGLLDEIGFAWKAGGRGLKPNDKLWHQQYEKLLKFKQKNGNCMVPQSYEVDKSLGIWVAWQRKLHNNNKMRLHRKIILDKIGFAWKAYTRAAPSSPMNVRGLVITSFHALGRSCFPLLTLVLFLLAVV
jgi:hypothetical protein